MNGADSKHILFSPLGKLGGRDICFADFYLYFLKIIING